MATPKFDNHDRKRVISEIERYYNVTLHKVGSRDKLLKDDTGKTYWVLGGTGDWHGIPKEMFAAEEKQATDGVLVIAKRKRNNIEIFVGSLQRLIENKSSLSQTDEQYQFDLKSSLGAITITKAPNVILKLIATIEYSKVDCATETAFNNLIKRIDKMPDATRKIIIRKLIEKK